MSSGAPKSKVPLHSGEVYRDKAALQSHTTTEHFERLVIKGLRPLAKQRELETGFPI